MSVLFLLALIGAAVAPLHFTGRGSRAGASWFDVLPHLTQSQKQRTRLQQTRRHGTRRY